MNYISKKTYDFLLNAYKGAVEHFFDDPDTYADGEPLKKVFEHLKEIGEELETDILTLVSNDEVEELLRDIEMDEDNFFSNSINNHIEAEIKPLKSISKNIIEDKLKTLSCDRKEFCKKIIGEWCSYEIKDE